VSHSVFLKNVNIWGLAAVTDGQVFLNRGNMAKSRRRLTRKKVRKPAASLRRDSIPRAKIAREVQRQIDKFGLSRELAGRVVDDAASQMSRLMRGHVGEFSADRLVKMLLRLGSSVTITIRHSRRLGLRGKVRIRVE